MDEALNFPLYAGVLRDTVPVVYSEYTARIGSFLWYRPGLCQCRFRIRLYRHVSGFLTANFSPASRG